MTTKNDSFKKHRKTFVGLVTSDKSDKTITVSVVTSKVHPIYKKRYNSTKKYHAHDENNLAKIGDKVLIIESRPKSALKRFDLKAIISKAEVIGNEPIAKEAKDHGAN